MKTFDHIQVCSMSSNREYFTTHGLHMNSKGTLWTTNKWASIILSILSRFQIMPAIALPWIKGSDNSYVGHENKNEAAIEGRNAPNEEEIGNYRDLKVKKTSDQKKSRPKEDIYYRVSDPKVLNEDNEELKDQNKSIGLSFLETSDQEISLAKDKNNFSASESIITSGFSEEVDKENLVILSGDKEEVKVMNESRELSLLETSDQGNSLDKDKGDIRVAELERTMGSVNKWIKKN
jgi:hypothetical protein